MTTNGFPTGSLEDEVIQDATEAVFGVTSARLRGHTEDAAAALVDYHDRCVKRGVATTRAWSLLFSAAVGQFTDVLQEQATALGIDDETALQRVALEHARSRG